MAIKVNLNNKFNGNVSIDWLEEHAEDFWHYASIEDAPDIKFATDCFISMVGGQYDFYGMDSDGIKLNDMIFQLLEDPDDGYRSYLGAARIADKDHKFIFFRKPVARIILATSDTYGYKSEVPDDFSGYVLVDISDEHVWALIGTGNTNDYYPFVVLDYRPKSPGKIR